MNSARADLFSLPDSCFCFAEIVADKDDVLGFFSPDVKKDGCPRQRGSMAHNGIFHLIHDHGRRRLLSGHPGLASVKSIQLEALNLFEA